MVSSESVTVTGTVLGVYSKVRIIPVAIESYIVIPAQGYLTRFKTLCVMYYKQHRIDTLLNMEEDRITTEQ